VAEHYGAHGVGGVIVAGVIRAVGVGAAIGLRAGQDVVLVGHIAEAFNRVALFIEHGGFGNGGAHARQLQSIAVQIGEAHGDALALGVEPRAVADAVARVDGIGALGAHVGVPGAVARAGGGGQVLAPLVGSGHPAVVGAVALGSAGDKERHRRRRTLLIAALRHGERRPERPDGQRAENELCFPHSVFPPV